MLRTYPEASQAPGLRPASFFYPGFPRNKDRTGRCKSPAQRLDPTSLLSMSPPCSLLPLRRGSATPALVLGQAAHPELPELLRGTTPAGFLACCAEEPAAHPAPPVSHRATSSLEVLPVSPSAPMAHCLCFLPPPPPPWRASRTATATYPACPLPSTPAAQRCDCDQSPAANR